MDTQQNILHKWSARSPFVIAGLLFIGLYLRIKAIPENGLWFDEMYSLWVSYQSFPKGILSALYNYDAHAPLYHFILHFFIKFFGTNDLPLQLFNILISLTSIPVVYLLGKELQDRKLGYLAATFLTINTFHISFSSEVRMYHLAGLLLTTAILFIFRLQRKPTFKYCTSLSIINILLCYTLTTACVYVFIEMFLLTIYAIYKQKQLLKLIFISSLITFIFYIPYIPFLLHQIYNSSHSLTGVYLSKTYTRTFIQNLEIFYTWISPEIYFENQLETLYELKEYLNIFTYIIIPIIILSVIFTKLLLNKPNKITQLFILFLSILTFHLTVLPFLLRYTRPLLPIFSILFAYGFLKISSKYIKLFIILYLTVTQLFSLINGTYYNGFKKNLRFTPLIQKLTNYNLSSDDMILKLYGTKLLSAKGIKAKDYGIDLCSDFFFFNEDKMNNILGKEYLQIKTHQEQEKYLENHLLNKKIFKPNEEFYNKQINNLKINQYFIVIDFDTMPKFITNEIEEALKQKFITYSQYKQLKHNLFINSKLISIIENKLYYDYWHLINNDERLKLIYYDTYEFEHVIMIYKKVKN